MTVAPRTIRFCLALGAGMALSGCLNTGGGGAGGGGGGGGGATVAQFDAAYNRITSLAPTSDMPATGTATYTGAAKLALNEGSTKIGDLLADLEYTIDLGAASADRTTGMSGKAGNFRGTVNGEEVAFAGEVTTAEGKARSLPQAVDITETTMTLPVVGTTTLRTGAIMANMAGELEVNGERGLVILQTGGNFFGPGGQAMSGPAGGSWWGPAGPSSYTVAGTWYAEK